MRWLFLFVLSLNLAYIAWQTAMPGGDSNMHVQPLKNVQPIVLLSEFKSYSAQSDEDEVVKKTSSHEPVAGKAAAELPAVEERAAEAEKIGPVAAETAAVKKETAVNADVKAPVPGHVKAASVSAPVSGSAEGSCYTLGPFRDLGELRSFTRNIKSYVVEADFRGREEKEQSLFWVYLQPEKTYKKAVETGQRLKNKKIKDFYIIREGEKIHGISLGHFKNKSGAYSLTKKVKNLGFDVHVEPVFKTYTVYWLDYQLVSGANIPESIFDRYIKVDKVTKISRLSRDCNNANR